MIWLTIVLCLGFSFVFSGIEAGILSVNRVRLAHREQEGDPAAVKLVRLLAAPERLLVTVLIVTNLMNITSVILCARELVGLLGPRGYWITLTIFLPLYLFVLELLPKSLFRRFPYRALAALAEPLRVADMLLAPMHFVGWRATKLLFGRAPTGRRKLFVAREDFKYLTSETAIDGELTHTERAMIHDVIDFRSVAASDVMLPMEKVQTVSSETPVEEFIEKARRLAFDRWPVVSETGEITGLADIFEIALEGRKRGAVGAFQRRIVRVNAHEPAYSVLRKLRAARLSMAIVVSEQKESLGIVTVEDLIRRLVSAAGKHETGATAQR